MNEIVERMKTEPEYRMRMEEEQKRNSEKMERRVKQPEKPAMRNETITQSRDFSLHESRH